MAIFTSCVSLPEGSFFQVVSMAKTTWEGPGGHQVATRWPPGGFRGHQTFLRQVWTALTWLVPGGGRPWTWEDDDWGLPPWISNLWGFSEWVILMVIYGDIYSFNMLISFWGVCELLYHFMSFWWDCWIWGWVKTYVKTCQKSKAMRHSFRWINITIIT